MAPVSALSTVLRSICERELRPSRPPLHHKPQVTTVGAHLVLRSIYLRYTQQQDRQDGTVRLLKFLVHNAWSIADRDWSAEQTTVNGAGKREEKSNDYSKCISIDMIIDMRSFPLLDPVSRGGNCSFAWARIRKRPTARGPHARKRRPAL